MSRPTHIESYLDGLAPICQYVDEVLGDWNGTGCFQMPTLISMVTVKFNWDEKTARAKDPVIRDYIRNHNPNYLVTRGAKGGIMRVSDKQKRIDAAVAKKKASEEFMAECEAKAAMKAAADSEAHGVTTDSD